MNKLSCLILFVVMFVSCFGLCYLESTDVIFEFLFFSYFLCAFVVMGEYYVLFVICRISFVFIRISIKLES